MNRTLAGPITLAVALAFTASAAEPTPAPPRPKPTKVIAFDFTAQGDAPASLGKVLAESAARELAKLEGTQVLTQADVSSQLGAEIKQTGSCADDRACMAEVAGAMDADRNLTGTIAQLGDSFILSITLVDARKMSTVGGAQETIKAAKPEQLLDAARRLAYRAYTGKLLETTGAIEFEVAESGATVLLDGKEIGTGPFRETQRVPEGMHAVTVMKTGFVTWETTVKVEAGGRSAVAPKLVEGEGGRNGPVYVELGFAFPVPLLFPATGLDRCSTTGGFLCSGHTTVGRLGYRFSPSLAAEVVFQFKNFRWWHDAASRDVGLWLTGGPDMGIAGVWNPAGNRFLGVAAEIGRIKGDIELKGGLTSSGSTLVSINSFYGGLQARLDYTMGRFQVGLRAGLLLVRFPETVTVTVPPVTASIEKGPALFLDLGFAARIWF